MEPEILDNYYLTYKEVVEKFKISKTKLYELKKTGLVKTQSNGSQNLFSFSDLKNLGYELQENYETQELPELPVIHKNPLILEDLINQLKESQNKKLTFLEKILVSSKIALSVGILALASFASYEVFKPDGILNFYENKKIEEIEILKEKNFISKKIELEMIYEKKEKERNEQNRQNAQLKKLVDKTKEVQISLKSLD